MSKSKSKSRDTPSQNNYRGDWGTLVFVRGRTWVCFAFLTVEQTQLTTQQTRSNPQVETNSFTRLSLQEYTLRV